MWHAMKQGQINLHHVEQVLHALHPESLPGLLRREVRRVFAGRRGELAPEVRGQLQAVHLKAQPPRMGTLHEFET